MACSSAEPGPCASIGFIAAGWAPDLGGIESHTALVARELRSRGWRVEALALDRHCDAAPYTWRDSEHEGERVRRVAYRYHDQLALADLARRDRAEELVLQWVRERALERVHIHHLTGFGASIPLVLREHGLRVWMSLHDYWMLCPRGQMWHAKGYACERIDDSQCARCLASTWPHLLPSGFGEPRGPRGERLTSDRAAVALRTEHALLALEACEHLLVPSRAALEVFVRAGVARERLTLAPHPIDATAIASAVERERACVPPRAEFVLGVLGAVQPSKGVLELAERVLACATPTLVLEIHGPRESYHGDRRYVESLEELARRSPQIRLMGPFRHAELARILARLDALAVPSRWNEVFGLAAREALAAGLPVLASRTGGLNELADTPGVILLDPEDSTAWIAALRELVGGNAAARRLSAPTAAPCTLSTTVEHLLRLYESPPAPDSRSLRARASPASG